MNALASALYAGEVTHQRLTPTRHRLRYRMFQMLFDLDELPALGKRLRLFSHNRFNLFSFHDRDHGDGRSGPLKSYVLEQLAKAGIDPRGGKVQLLCMPRLFGHVFNPISIFYCRGADGAPVAMLYEVSNTFGHRHSYLIPVAPRASAVIRQSCDKALHVSPFMDMDMVYDFAISEPGDSVATTITGRGGDGRPIIVAAFEARRRALSDRSLLAALWSYPLLTLKVVAAIHWEAVKLLAKGLRLRPIPPPPATAVTLVASGAAAAVKAA